MDIKNTKALGGLVTVLTSVVVCSCSTPSKPLSASNRIPAGQGSVRVRTDSNQNTTLEIAVNHLAPPDRVSLDSKTYVVWIEPIGEESRPQNLGALSIDPNLNGRLETVTPFRSFDLFVTAEPSAITLRPSGERMLWAQVNDGRVS